MMTKSEKQKLINSVPFWFHSIDCGDGIITNGSKPLPTLQSELECMAVPNLSGKSVLDIGAWDGYFSFAAEASGAQRVMALDHYVWSMNLAEQQQYWRECQEKSVVPMPYHLKPGLWEPGSVPGKAGFDTIHQIKGSSVEQLVGDFMTINPLDVGLFDIVFFLGVLYHLEEPFHGLKRLSLFTKELAIIETAAVYLKKYEDVGLFEFYESNELGADVGNWFAPNLSGLIKSCRAAGFKEVKVKSPYPPILPETLKEGEAHSYRLTVHAYK